ncbi:MAG: NADPH-dependent F420 reductase [Thermoplasmatota archaeon]
MAKPKLGIIGKGNVGTAIVAGAKRAGYEVRTTGKDPKGVHDTLGWADVVVLALPFTAAPALLRDAGAVLDGKILIDATNVVGPEAVAARGHHTSGAQAIVEAAKGAHVVKGFNTIFAQHMSTGTLNGAKLAFFVAGDSANAKRHALDLARDIGFDAIDAGPLANARLLEEFGALNIALGYGQKLGTGIGFTLAR